MSLLVDYSKFLKSSFLLHSHKDNLCMERQILENLSSLNLMGIRICLNACILLGQENKALSPPSLVQV